MIVLKISKAKLLPLLRAFEVFAPCRCLPVLGMAAAWSTGCPQETCIVKAVQRFDRRSFYEILSQLRRPAGRSRPVLHPLRHTGVGYHQGRPRAGTAAAHSPGKRRPGGGPASARRTGRRCQNHPRAGTAAAHSPGTPCIGRSAARSAICWRPASATPAMRSCAT